MGSFFVATVTIIGEWLPNIIDGYSRSQKFFHIQNLATDSAELSAHLPIILQGFNQPSQLVKSDLGHQLYHFFPRCAVICKDCIRCVKFSHESATFENTGLPFVSFAKQNATSGGRTQHLTVESHHLADLSFACAVASIAPQLAERHLRPTSSTV